MTAERRILVVDDTEQSRYAMARTLRRAGYTVAEAGSAAEAFAKLVPPRPDLIILDVKLPDLSGIEVARRIRQDPRTQHIPIIQVSASFVRTSDKVEGLDAGADIYLASPIQPEELLAYARTLVRLKEAQDELRKREARYRSLVEASAQIVWTATARGRMGPDNTAWREFTGQSAEEVLGGRWLEAVHPEDREATDVAWRDACERRWIYETEYRLRRRDGVWRNVLARGVPILGEDGDVVEFVGVCIDITERKTAEQALRESEERFRTMADGTPLPIWVTDATGKMEYVNKAFCNFFGITGEAARAKDVVHFMHADDVLRHEKLLQEALKGCRDFRSQARVQRHDGAWRWVESHGRPRVQSNGQCGGLAVTSTDITERKEFQAELERKVAERTRSLEETTRQLNDFVYSVAHDLKAPLRAQSAFAHALVEDFGQEMSEQARLFAGRIEQAADRQGKLINDLLSHISVGRGDMPLEPVSLPGVFGLARADCDFQVTESGGLVNAEGLVGTVLANPASLRLVLSNLLLNAIKFVQPGTRPVVRIWSEPDGESTRVFVQDQGIGIPREYFGKLFGAFQRLHTREGYPGTGMGLAIVKRATERMGGQVGVESEVGKGSRFWVALKNVQPE